MVSKRNMSLDLLRIISMIMIVVLHILGKGGGLSSSISLHRDVSWFIESFCIVAVNIYVLISGYFLYDSNFSWGKVFKIWRQVIFYSVLFLLLFFFMGYEITLKELLFSVFPITFKENYWFITCYLFMYVSSPFLNILLKNINKNQHFNICIFIVVVFSIISLFLPFESRLDITNGYSIIWFICLYIIAAYFKKVDIKFKNNNTCLKLYISICLINFCTYLAFDRVGMVFYDRLYWYNSITVLLSSIFLFLFFKGLSIKNKKLSMIIKKITPLMLGVYLVHENIFIRKVLYSKIFNLGLYANLNALLLFPIITILTLIIFSSCCIIDYARLRLFRYLSKKISFTKLDGVIVGICNKVIFEIKKFIPEVTDNEKK